MSRVARDPAISFRGALKILGHHERDWLDRLDALVGGVILSTGLAPASTFAAMWGWVDQKNEASRLLRRMLDGVADRIAGTGGYHRHELVAASHTVLVLTSFFDAVEGDVGHGYQAIKLSDTEKVTIATQETCSSDDPLLRHLYSAPVPAPSAVCGFDETVPQVKAWAAQVARHMQRFLLGLSLSSSVRLNTDLVARATEANYRSNYLRMLATVPEFALWADMIEHAATRSALARLERLLLLGPQREVRDLCHLIGEANRAELSRPVIDVDVDGYGMGSRFPLVDEVFQSPRYRLCSAKRDSAPASETWWEKNVPIRGDLETVLARHFSSPESTRTPMLLLGHPGAGKSLLMKVLAARLPTSSYTVVRVPLRRVDANTTVGEQIRQALDSATGQRVSWPELSEQSADTMRVILLDGLDELLQATMQDRHGYIHEIAEFQRVEGVMNRPVAVVVTSRTLLAEKVALVEGMPLLKLEDFDEDQIRNWIYVWNQTNGDGPSRPMSVEAALAQADLASQPLLLVLLTLYYSDPSVDVDVTLSTTELYGQLFSTFAQREATKQAGGPLREEDLKRAVGEQINRLAVAALGMFNRGLQRITEADLTSDLVAFEEELPSGRRVLGEFFFVHTAEAQTEAVQRSYEFLHSTFGEYLVATKVFEAVMETAAVAYGGRAERKPDDDLLFALLSHQPLSLQRPALDFIRDHFSAVPAVERNHAIRLLNILITGFRQRRRSRDFVDYRPLSEDSVRSMAAYSVNLVLLRVLAHGGDSGLPLGAVWPGRAPLERWRSCVALWEAGLEPFCFESAIHTLSCRKGALAVREQPPSRQGDWHSEIELERAYARDDPYTVLDLATSHAILGRAPLPVEFEPSRSQGWRDRTMSILCFLAVRPTTDWPDGVGLTFDLEWNIRREHIEQASRLGWEILAGKRGAWPQGFARELADWLCALPATAPKNLAFIAAARHQEVYDLINNWFSAKFFPNQFDRWTDGPALMELAQAWHRRDRTVLDNDFRLAIEALLDPGIAD